MSNNGYLLDTNCLLWFQNDDPKLPKHILSIIENSSNTIYFSQISLFEIAIKLKVEKLPQFTATTQEVFRQAIKDKFNFLRIENEHIYTYQTVPLLKGHRDPFVHLLLGTA